MGPRRNRERGVSPVVATVLLVAIVLVLGSVLAFNFLGVVERATQEPAPQASFSYLQNGNALTITHEAGETIPAEELALQVGETDRAWQAAGPAQSVSAGDAAQLVVSGEKDVRVLWSPPDSDRSSVLSERTVTAPETPTFTGTNEKIKTNGDGGDSDIGFGDKRLEAAGYSSSGHARILWSKDKVQFRDQSESELSSSSISLPTDGTTRQFTLTYDGTTLTLTVAGATVATDQISVGGDALVIQLKNRDPSVTTAEVSELKIDGASIGSPDGFSTTTDQGARSLLLSNGSFTDGFTLSGTFRLEATGSGTGEAFGLRVDFAT
ncbi:type IV pilin [Halobellus sp. Atlit-31R]|nr:type IV pilin [Halobellus sp. Atlit-31R]